MNKEQVSAIASLVWLVLSVVSSILVQRGFTALPFTEAQVLQTVTILSTVMSGLWAWWKNNNISTNAQQAQAFKSAMDHGELVAIVDPVGSDNANVGENSQATSESVNPSAEVEAATPVLAGGTNKETES